MRISQQLKEKRKVSITIKLMSAFLISSIFAQSIYAAVGESAVITLVFPVGARATGLGEAFTGLSDDLNAVYFNPAGLGQAPLANAWRAFLVNKDKQFTALASKTNSGFGVDEKIWAGTHKGLIRYNGKTWEDFEPILFEPGKTLENIAEEYLAIDDQKAIENAIWKIREFNQIGMKHYKAAQSILAKKLDMTKLAKEKSSLELICREITSLPQSDRTSAKVYGIISPFVDSSTADALSDQIAEKLLEPDIELETMVELKIPFTIAISDSITTLLIDRSERLWVGTPNGLWRYHESKWSVFSTVDNLPSNLITSLALGPAGEIAVGTNNGCAILENGQWKNPEFNKTLPDSHITALAYGASGTLFIGTNKGLNKWKDSTIVLFDESKGLLSNHIEALMVDSKGKLWIGGENGVVIYNETSWKRFKFPNSHISSFAEHPNGSIWIGTNKGAISYKPGEVIIGPDGNPTEGAPEWRTFHSKNAMKGDDVKSITIHGYDIWIATKDAINLYDNANRQAELFWEPLLPTFGLRELWHTFGGVLWPFQDWGTLGFSVNYINMGFNKIYDDLGRESEAKRSWEGIFNLSWGMPLQEDLSIGTNLKFVYSALAPGYGDNGEGVGYTFAVDAAILKRNLIIPNLSLGFMMQNMGPDISYISQESKDPLPFTLRLGLAYTPIQKPYHELNLALDLNREFVKNNWDRPPDPFYRALIMDLVQEEGETETTVDKLTETNVSLGAEYWYAGFIALRCGFMADYVGERYELTPGIGLHYGNLNFDWSYIHAPEGFMRWFSEAFDENKKGANGARNEQWRVSFLLHF